MSKLSFRSRAPDATKPMPVYRASELHDLHDFAAINRSVPQMPTGMEKEEECETHLQRAISAQQTFGHTGEGVIPTPECVQVPESYYNELYPPTLKQSRGLIRVQPFAIDESLPEYDMDAEDVMWLTQESGLKIPELRFESMMELFEKSSCNKIVTFDEAKLLVSDEEVVIVAIYDYWVDKRLRKGEPLMPTVKTERRDGSNNNPYVAFRRRTEKMQTRKNRKNDEASYEKMLKLKKDFQNALKLLGMVRERERLKTQDVKLTVGIFDKRYLSGDYSGQMLAEAAVLNKGTSNKDAKRSDKFFKEEKGRSLKKKKVSNKMGEREKIDLGFSSDDDHLGANGGITTDPEDENPDGPYAFKRLPGLQYHKAMPYGNHQPMPWDDNPFHIPHVDRRPYRFYCTRKDSNMFCRPRIGRGGRIAVDRYLCRTSVLPDSLRGDVHASPNMVTPTGQEEGDSSDYDEDGNPIPVVFIPYPPPSSSSPLSSPTSSSLFNRGNKKPPFMDTQCNE